MLAHEIKNPLSGIRGAAQLLEQSVTSEELPLARLIREETDASLPAVGELLGGRDHTTIMYGYKKVADMIERDDSLRRQLISLRERLYSQVGAPS